MENLDYYILRLFVVLLALTIHEFAHAYSAYRLGDHTARLQGRLTLNPIAHLDPLGTLCIMFAPIGWARPVPVNPLNFRRPGRDDIIVAVAGPVSNLIQAFCFALLMRGVRSMDPSLISGDFGDTVKSLLFLGVLVNVALACFNMLPIFPLDGHHVVREMLPYEQREMYMSHYQYGPFIILGLVFFGRGFLGSIIAPVLNVFMAIGGSPQYGIGA
jgi:Zn-dependent protease